VGLEVAHFGESRSTEPVVIATSTINALAATPYQTWAFRRAEITGFVGSPFRLPSGNALTFARVRQLDPRLVGADRLVALAGRALEPLGELIARVPAQARLGVVLCLAERCDTDEQGRRARRRLESTVLGPLIERGYQVMGRTIAKGHASFGYAAREVGAMLESGQMDLALVLGVDSYYDPFVLEALFEEERVLDSDWRESFVPGEAASAVVLARADVARDLGVKPMATLDSVATNEEVATVDNDVGLLALGLSRAAVAVVKRLKKEKRTLDWWISDATGEPFRIHELELAWPRAAHLAMTPEGRLDLFPSHFGDIGAATMPTAVAVAIEGLRRGDPNGRTCLMTGSSNGSARGAALIGTRDRG
jgi:3-oxoacyl-[acyl-carrier-protein] synthase-1